MEIELKIMYRQLIYIVFENFNQQRHMTYLAEGKHTFQSSAQSTYWHFPRQVLHKYMTRF